MVSSCFSKSLADAFHTWYIRPKTHCELHRDRVQHTGPDGHPIVGAHIPQCDEHGHYQPQQCHGSTGHCWCVDDKGQERPGTRTPPGTPHVDCRRPGEVVLFW
uniref:Thyroglobulin type-1 domain-containing protein n=1 Tax=Nothobranchius furzeri TaxID=105023 RepID=A0A8C6KI34_NOTFU